MRAILRPRTTLLVFALLGLACAVAIGEPSLSQIHKIYWPNGQLRAQGQVIDGLKEGRWTYWHVYGEKKEQGGFRAGLRDGEWTSWHPSGQVRAVMHYQADQLHGHFVSYRADGSRAEEGEFVSGERHGRWTALYPANKGWAEILYERGEAVSRRDVPPAVSARPSTR